MARKDDNKRIIGLYGEMLFAMELHEKDWQVYRAYIDENVDFIIARYYCNHCNKYSKLKRRKEGRKEFPVDLCYCCEKKDVLDFKVRFIQIKTSEGIKGSNKNERKYSFHAKLRSNVGDNSYYVWIAIFKYRNKKIPHYYIFKHGEINKFDNLSLDSYQKTDNQKTTLRIDKNGSVLNKGTKHSYDCFNNDFHNNFDKFL